MQEEESKADLISLLDNNVMCSIFNFFSQHEQLCQLSHVSRRFRRIFNEFYLHKMVVPVPSEVEQSDHLKNIAINSFRLFHAVRNDSVNFRSVIKDDWALAAYIGDQEMLLTILGQSIREQRDVEGRHAIHFAALGGQLPLLKYLELICGREAISSVVDIGGWNCLYAAAWGRHFATMKWLIVEHGLSMYSNNEVSYSKNSKFCSDLLMLFRNRELSDMAALELAPLLVHGQNNSGNDIIDFSSLIALLQTLACPPEFQASYAELDSKEINRLISLTTKLIACAQKREYLPFLIELVSFQRNNLQMVDSNKNTIHKFMI